MTPIQAIRESKKDLQRELIEARTNDVARELELRLFNLEKAIDELKNFYELKRIILF